MMPALVARAERAALARAARHAASLADHAEAKLGDTLRIERLPDGIALHGTGLVRRLAFDGRLRDLSLATRRDR